jgi:hypothetical protein
MPEKLAYMVMSRCTMDLKFYITTMTGYCGNCTDYHIYFGGGIKNHVEKSLSLYETLPDRPKWLHRKKLHRLASKAMKLSEAVRNNNE